MRAGMCRSRLPPTPKNGCRANAGQSPARGLGGLGAGYHGNHAPCLLSDVEAAWGSRGGWVGASTRARAISARTRLTRTEYSTSSPNRPVSLRVYLAFFTLASTGPFSIWCLMARNSLYKGSPAESWRAHTHTNTQTQLICCLRSC